MKYFDAFPTINYNNVSVKNILARVKVLEAAKNVASIYHPFTVLEGERPEKIAFDYYGSVDYVWVIFIVNNMIDPYYDWPLSIQDFESYLTNKYGSVEVAQSQILFYQKNLPSYYVSITDPNDYFPANNVVSDTSGYQLITSNNTIQITNDTFALNPDASYSPVYAYDYEHDLNESKRNIKLLDRGYLNLMNSDLKNFLSQ